MKMNRALYRNIKVVTNIESADAIKDQISSSRYSYDFPLTVLFIFIFILFLYLFEMW